ncbi:MAG: ribonuclease P protein component [Pseudomonadota bacterium]|nr:ribonuclease P protein component [Pseudomonadota bacterium]
MSNRAPARFPKTVRVRSRAQYSRVFEQARRYHHAAMTLHRAVLDEAGTARLGLAVSRKVDKRAVVRNRIKRVLRETFRQHLVQLLPGDVVVVVKPAAAGLGNAALAEAFLTLLLRSGALPQVQSGGKMPANFYLSQPRAGIGQPEKSIF